MLQFPSGNAVVDVCYFWASKSKIAPPYINSSEDVVFTSY